MSSKYNFIYINICAGNSYREVGGGGAGRERVLVYVL